MCTQLTRLFIGLMLLLCLPAKAQSSNDAVKKDTLLLEPESGIRILITGKFEKMSANPERADSLKQFLFSDLDTAIRKGDFPVKTQHAYYFVHSDGRRILKAESEDTPEAQIDPKAEIANMNLHLPSITWVIYDLSEEIEYRICLQQPELLNHLRTISLTRAVKAALPPHSKDWKNRRYRIDMSLIDSLWNQTYSAGNVEDLIEISPSFGLSLTGSRWSPVASLEATINLNNKYGRPYLKAGIGYGLNVFTSLPNDSINDLQLMTVHSAKVLWNLTPEEKKGKWVGLRGLYTLSTNHLPLNKKFGAGFCTEGFGPFNYSFDLLLVDKKTSIYSITLTLPF